MLKCDMFLASIALEIILFTNGYKKKYYFILYKTKEMWKNTVF